MTRSSSAIPRPPLEYLLFAVGIGALLLALDASVAGGAARLPRMFAWLASPVTQLGTAPYIFVACAVIAAAGLGGARLARRPRVAAGYRVLAERAAYVFATVAAAGVAVQIVKHLVGRARPRYLETLGPYHFDGFALKASFASFPSGHATTAFAAAGAIGLVWPRSRGWLLVVATLVALSRIILGAHYPSDVVAGAALGLGVAVGVAATLARVRVAFRPGAHGVVLRGRRAARLAFATAMRPR